LRVHKASKELRVHKANRVRQVRQVSRVHKANKELQERMVLMDEMEEMAKMVETAEMLETIVENFPDTWQQALLSTSIYQMERETEYRLALHTLLGLQELV
jgi:hypothetical protein